MGKSMRGADVSFFPRRPKKSSVSSRCEMAVASGLSFFRLGTSDRTALRQSEERQEKRERLFYEYYHLRSSIVNSSRSSSVCRVA